MKKKLMISTFDIECAYGQLELDGSTSEPCFPAFVAENLMATTDLKSVSIDYPKYRLFHEKFD